MKTPYRVSFSPRALLVVLTLGCVGCVPYTQYEMVKNERDRMKTTHEDLVAKYNSAIQKILRLEKDGSSDEALQAKLANLQNTNRDLLAKLQQQVTPFSEADIKKLEGKGVEFEQGGIRLGENILFDAGVNTLKKGAGEILDSVVEILQKDHPNEIIHLSGHTDSDPLNRTKKRWDTNTNLGYQRAYTVFRYFMDKGVPEKRMVLHSLGFLKPIADNTSTEGKARNRRVVIDLGGTQI